MGKTPCSNCGQTSCNGIDCYYVDEPEPTPDMVLVRRGVLNGLIAAEDDPHKFVVVLRKDLATIWPIIRNGIESWQTMKIMEQKEYDAVDRLKNALEGNP